MSTPYEYASHTAKPHKRWLGIGVVVLLHVAIFWAINSGLARAFVKKIKPPVEAVLLEETKPDLPPPPPPPPPKNLPPPPPSYVPTADVPVAAAPAVNAIAAVSATPQPVAPLVAMGPPAPKSEPVRTAAVVLASQCEKPVYPSASLRLEEEGTVSLRLLVGTDGRVVQAEIEKSSGFKRLDEAAKAGLSRCQFKPASVDGKAEQAWANMKYTWRIE